MATNMQSPGVEVLEIDMSAIVPTVSNSVAVFAGSFTQGKTGQFVQVSNSVELEGFFGKPTKTNYNDWYQCKTFLDYANTLLISRGLSATAKNAIGFGQMTTSTIATDGVDVTASNTDVIGNDTDFESAEPSITFPSSADKDVSLKFISKNPGVWGNSINIAIAKSTDFGASKYAFDGIGLDEQFEYPAGAGEYAVLVQYNGEIVERYIVSFDETARDASNRSMYIETAINSASKYIYVKDNTTLTNAATAGTEVKSYIFSNTTDKVITLSDGNDGAELSDGEIEAATAVWENKEEVDKILSPIILIL